MNTKISAAALANQKNARQSDGTFGTQLHQPSPVTLSAQVSSPISPKVTSRGRTVYVTLPDGSVVDRTSKTREYTHAILCSPEDPAIVRAIKTADIKKYSADVAQYDAALAAPLKIRSKQLNRSVDPDVDYRGNPSYNSFEYTAYAADGKTALATTRGNSKRELKGTYDAEGNYDVNRPGKLFDEMPGFLKAKRDQIQEWVENAEAVVKSIDDETYDPGSWSAWSFSASAANAGKTARSDGSRMPARSFHVVEIDK